MAESAVYELAISVEMDLYVVDGAQTLTQIARARAKVSQSHGNTHSQKRL